MRAADSHVDNVREQPAAMAGNAACAHAVAEFAHARECCVYQRQHVHAPDVEQPVAAQGGVQGGTVLARVDLLAREQVLYFVADAALACERHEQLHGPGVDQVLGVVEQQPALRKREIFEALRIVRKHPGDAGAGDSALVRGQSLPGSRLREGGHR